MLDRAPLLLEIEKKLAFKGGVNRPTDKAPKVPRFSLHRPTGNEGRAKSAEGIMRRGFTNRKNSTKGKKPKRIGGHLDDGNRPYGAERPKRQLEDRLNRTPLIIEHHKPT